MNTNTLRDKNGNYSGRKLKTIDETLLLSIKEKTKFLQDDVSIRERLFCIDNNITKRPLCGCGNYVKFHASISSYSTYCSRTCDHKKKACSSYGCDNSFSRPEVKEKIKQTNLSLYGHENPGSSNEVKEKIKRTMMRRYGVSHISKSSEHQSNCRETFFKKTGRFHHTQSHVDNEMFIKLNDKKWLEEQIKTRPTCEISDELGVSVSTIWVWCNKYGISIPRHSVSVAEMELRKFIETVYDGEIVFNDRTIIHPHEIDIVLPDIKVAIEYNGIFWHSTHRHLDKNYHLNKLNQCNQQGYRLITIFEDEWIHKKEVVKSKIAHILGKTTEKIYGRSCSIINVSPKVKKDFLEKHHIQGNGRGSVSFGLTHNDMLISVITFIKHDNVYELNRFASSCNVVGGFSKLLKHFERNVTDWVEIFTFADMRWSDSVQNVYIKNGFGFVHKIRPNYFYVDCHKTKRLHRRNFTKQKLKNIVDNFDDSLTEFEITQQNNIHRIYDCGNIKYKITKSKY